MAFAIRMMQPGGPDVLLTKPVQTEELAPHEAWIVQEAIGVNNLDAMQRQGTVPVPFPGGIGLEAAGHVAAVGSAVTNVAVGDRVAYALGPLGAYAQERAYPAERLISLHDDMSFDIAATVTFKGITAQYLLKTTYPVGPNDVVLLYGVAGALGQLMVPWAKHLGAFVIGVVSKESSVEIARARGCDAVLVWGTCDLPAEVAVVTGGRKADVVYDGIGKATFEASLDSLRPRGVMVSIGASSGTPEPVQVGTLNAKGSLFLTRPSIAAHASDLNEYRERVADVYAAVAQGIISPQIWQSYPLERASEAHAALENGSSSGPIVLRSH